MVFRSYVHIILVRVVTLHCNPLDVLQHVRGTLYSWSGVSLSPLVLLSQVFLLHPPQMKNAYPSATLSAINPMWSTVSTLTVVGMNART
jgi:hypothetical protein